MEHRTRARWVLGSGVALVAQTFVDVAPEGPWSSASFTRGMLGLSGLVALYVGWYALAFDRFGVAPTVDRWSSPETTWLNVVVVGLVMLLVSRTLGRLQPDGVPEPAGLLVGLIGSLTLANGLYVWAVVNGPLRTPEAGHEDDE